jgi:hypothetical protein
VRRSKTAATKMRCFGCQQCVELRSYIFRFDWAVSQSKQQNSASKLNQLKSFEIQFDSIESLVNSLEFIGLLTAFYALCFSFIQFSFQLLLTYQNELRSKRRRRWCSSAIQSETMLESSFCINFHQSVSNFDYLTLIITIHSFCGIQSA